MFSGLAPGQTVGTVQGQRTAVMATGANFPDALAASMHGAATGSPILLTNTPPPPVAHHRSLARPQGYPLEHWNFAEVLWD